MKKKVYLLMVLSYLVTMLVGCGGGGGSDSEPPEEQTPIELTGVVQKGEFTNLIVTAKQMNKETGDISPQVRIYMSESSNSNYRFELESAGIYELEASGTFISELSGEKLTLDEPLRSIIEVGTESESKKTSNINLYTYLEAKQIQRSLNGGKSLVEARAAAKLFVKQSFGLDSSVEFESLNLKDINEASTIRDANLQLLLLSAAALEDADEKDPDAFSFSNGIVEFGNYITPEQAVAGLKILDGASAVSLYRRLTEFLPDLPSNLPALDREQPVFVCLLNICNYQIFNERTVSLQGDDVVESKARIRLALQLSSASDQDIQVLLTSIPIAQNATPGIDYVPVERLIAIPAGVDRVQIDTDLLLDNATEFTEVVRYTLTAVGGGYTIANGNKLVTVFDGFGNSGEGLDDKVEISSICLSALGDGLNIESQGCLNTDQTFLPQQETAAAGIDLSLQIICDTENDTSCVPSKRNWLVQLSLQTKNSQNIAVSSVVLGKYLFPGRSLHESNEQAIVETVFAHIDAEALGLIAQAKEGNLTLALNAKLLEVNQLANAGLTDVFSTPVLLPAQIFAGDRLLDYSLESIKQIVGCDGDNYQVTASFADSGRLAEGSNLASVCVTLNEGASPEETTATLVEGEEIPLSGLAVALPAFHSSHLVYGDNRLQTLGANYLIVPSQLDNGQAEAQRFCANIGCYRGQDIFINPLSDPPTPLEDLSIYLHAEGLPFAYKVVGGFINSDGIQLVYNAVKYVQSGEFDSRDSRAAGEIYSNDIFYRNAVSIGDFSVGVISLTANGINAQMQVPAGEGKHAFPKSELTWATFEFDVVDSQMTTSLVDSNFSLSQSTRCESCTSNESMEYNLEGSMQLQGNGSGFGVLTIVGGSAVSPITPTWGRVSSSKAFQRPQDLTPGATAVVALPGFVFPDRVGHGLDIDLLGHIEAVPAGAGIPTSLILNSTLSIAAQEGNHWPTGITLGPQYYFNNIGEPDVGTGRTLSSKVLRMSNGIDEYDLAVNDGAKYVIRNAGITGVFNIDIDPVAGAELPFYGYDMRFDRFAFRQTDNTLDEYSWIDGLIHIPGKDETAEGNGNFDTEFTSLALGCDAKFAKGIVSYCDNDLCQQSLEAWKGNTDIINMAFSGAGGEEPTACLIETQVLKLDQTLEMHALDKPVGIIDAVWLPQGKIDSSKFAPSQALILDAKSNSGKQGFAFSPNMGGLDLLSSPANYGVVNFNNTKFVAGPFWNQMRVDIRVSNTLTGAEPAVVVATGMLDNIDDEESSVIADKLVSNEQYEAFNPEAIYHWGASNFGFELPVYYSSGGLSEQSRFYGRYLETDLLVMQAGAGIDYIEPVETKLSFGVSANIPELGSLPFRVDISDLGSLQDVDGLLATFNVNLGLENIFTSQNLLQPLLKDILRLSNGGINNAIEKSLDEILTQSANVGDVNLWSEIVEPLASIQSLPFQLDAVLNENINEYFETEIIGAASRMRIHLSLLQAILQRPELQDELVVTAEFQGDSVNVEFQLRTAVAREALNDMRRATSELTTQVDQVRAQALSLIDQVEGQVTRLNSAIDAVALPGALLSSAVNVNQNVCNFTELAQIEADDIKLLAPGIKQVKNIDDALQELQGITDIAGALSALYTGESELNRQFQQTLDRVSLEAERLRSEWNDAASGFRSAVCREGEDQYLGIAQDQLAQLKASVSDFGGSFQQIRGTINQQFDRQLVLIQSLDTFASGFDAILADRIQLFSDPLALGTSNLTVAEFRTDIKDSLGELSRDISLDLGFEVNIGVLGVTGFGDDLDFVQALVNPVKLQIDAQAVVLRETLHAGLSLPGANYSADEFKDMLIRSIIASPAVGTIRLSANQYLQSYINELIDFQLVINDQINLGIKAQVAKAVASPLNDFIAEATAELPLPVTAVEINGGATITNNNISRLSLSAVWETVSPTPDIEGNKFSGLFVARREGAIDDTTSCGLDGGVRAFSVTIAGAGPMNLGGAAVDADVILGFTLDESRDGISAYFPVALNGGITVEGAMDYEPFVLHDFGFDAGIGLSEAYIGAGGAGSFSGIGLGLYAFIGRTCDASTISNADIAVAELLESRFQSDQPFTGFYARGRAMIPVVDSGTCLLSVSADAQIGAWVTVEPTFKPGGLIGGGISGQLACIGSVRGQLTTAGEYNLRGSLFYTGQAFAVGGAGFDCDKDTWTSVGRSRGDDWCGTVDISVDVTYEDENWSYNAGGPSGPH